MNKIGKLKQNFIDDLEKILDIKIKRSEQKRGYDPQAYLVTNILTLGETMRIAGRGVTVKEWLISEADRLNNNQPPYYHAVLVQGLYGALVFSKKPFSKPLRVASTLVPKEEEEDADKADVPIGVG
jgi:hypothetical protein